MDALEYDVIVVGGGTAGVVAAVQSGRMGAKTLLVEKSSRLGGTVTNGGVPAPGVFFAWGRQVIAGIGWDLVRRTAALMDEPKPDITNPAQWHLRIDPNVFACVCDEAVLKSGCDLILHCMPAEAKQRDDGTWTLSVCTKTGLLCFSAKLLIDCTGDANLAEIAGMPLIIPGSCQPSTLCFRMSGYDPGKLDLDSLTASFRETAGAGGLKIEDGCWRIDKADPRQIIFSMGMNANHIRSTSEARTSRGRTELEIEGRRAVMRLYSWLRGQAGMENIRLEFVFPELGVRESAQIDGETVISISDFESGRCWPDSLCYAIYGVDLHGMDSSEWKYWKLKEGVVPSIPRGALIPKGSRNFMAAGRIMSADRLALSGLRVQAACMATGQAAGAMGALSAKSGDTPLALDVAEIKSVLKRHGAIVPHGLDKEI